MVAADHRRLRDRGTETEQDLETRLNHAAKEIEARDMYDYLVVNDRLEQAEADLRGVILAQRLRMDRAEKFWPRFFGKDS